MPTYRRLAITHPFYPLCREHATSLIPSSTFNTESGFYFYSGFAYPLGWTHPFQAHPYLLQIWVAVSQIKILATRPRPQIGQGGIALIPVTPGAHLDVSIHQYTYYIPIVSESRAEEVKP